MQAPPKAYSQYCKDLTQQEQSTVSVKKEALLRIALVFPNTYEVGMSNLGFQEVYRLFNAYDFVSCERVFLLPPPFHTQHYSLESGRILSDFDVIAFSVSFELDIPNVLTIIKNVQINLQSSKRNPREPLVICGGVITMLNPTPLAPFIDVFLLGEAQSLINQFLECLFENRGNGFRSQACLHQLAQNPAFWVPEITAANSEHKIIRKDERQQPIQSSLISSKSHFKDMHLIEVGRACSRGCRFCAACFIYQPTRFYSMEQIIEAAKINPFKTSRIGLVGSALSDFPQLHELCRKLSDEDFQLGLSSFRLDMISPEFLKILENAGVKSLTLAPEAGSERLRNIIHKQISDEQIFEAINALNTSSISIVKFYFLIGLPFETKPDIEAIIYLISKIRAILNRSISISVSINAFIPKPRTPFQWFELAPEKEIKQKRKFLTQELRKIPRVQVVPKSTKTEILQALFSQGSEKISPLLRDFVEKKQKWNQILNQHAQFISPIIFERKEFEQKLPWDFLQTNINKNGLIKIAKKVSGKN